MALHLIKLCVGAESVEDLADWQARYLKALRKRDPRARLWHTTRQTPKRAEELVEGGSLYWVIKGWTAVRQRILALEPTTEDGVPHCGIVLDPPLIPVERRAQRPFQGWRYLKAEDAPRDLPRSAAGLPPELQRTLAELGLL